MTNGRYDEYQADALNRYVSRDVLGVVDVRGCANATAAVLVNDLPASRSADGGFYAAVVVENGAAPVAPAIKIQATNGGNAPLVATEPRSAFLPQTPESYDYDLDGNLTRDGRWSYTWDGENRLVGLETRTDVAAALLGLSRQKLTFAYDAHGRRILKRVFNWNTSTSTYILNSETKFLYDGWNLLAEYNGLNANALVRSYVWGPDLSGSLQGAGGVGGLLWATVAPGSTSPAPGNYAPAYDGNGNIVAWIDLADSSADGQRDYGAFGEPVLATGPATSLPFAFSTKYRDAETEMYYYGFRYYNPSTGRWPSRDPIQENGGLNLYGMVGNNPLNNVDPLGQRAYVARNSVRVFPSSQQKKLKCGTLKVGTIYLDADPADRIMDVDPGAYGRISKMVPPNGLTHSWKLLSDARTLGGGFEITFEPDPKKCVCLCDKVYWKQYITADENKEKLDYSYDKYPNNSTADIPSFPFPYENNNRQATFRLQLICRSVFGIDTVMWEGHWVFSISSTPTQSTVSLAIDL